MPTGQYGHSEAGKGDTRRPSAISDLEWTLRWQAAFARCCGCGKYLSEHGQEKHPFMPHPEAWGARLPDPEKRMGKCNNEECDGCQCSNSQ